MNTRQILKIFLFVFCFVLISLSGYQCSTQVIREQVPGGSGTPPVSPNVPLRNFENLSEKEKDQFNQIRDKDDDSCRFNRSTNLRNKISAKVYDLRWRAFKDYRLGKQANYEPDCARLYVELDRVLDSGNSYYTGNMKFVYKGTCANGQSGICDPENPMITGYDTSDARFNGWSKGEKNILKKDNKFKAIFEDEAGAYILSIELVKKVDVKDGFDRFIGAGSIFVKMFKATTVNEINTRHNHSGDCYNRGTYISNLEVNTPRNKLCWILGSGPFSCRPDGDLTEVNLHNKNSFKCFTLLGDFYGLDIEEALHIEINDRGEIQN